MNFIAALHIVIDEGALDLAARTLELEFRHTARWRVLKRLHLERQLRIVELCRHAALNEVRAVTQGSQDTFDD